MKALVRPQSESKINDPRVEKIVGDITDKSSFSSALKGVENVYHLAGVVTDWAPANYTRRK